MTLFFLQSSAPPPGPGGGTPVWALFMLVPVLMVISGMALGFQALKDIRLAEGRLGGAMTATLAAAFLPAMLIVIACGAGMVMLAEEYLPRERSRSGVWSIAGGAVGVWLSFLMMQGMYRRATGWVRPAESSSRSSLTAAAIVLTIVGGGLTLIVLTMPRQRQFVSSDGRQMLALLDLAALLGGLICGVLGRRESAARVCAWISGSLFVLLVLLLFA